MFVSILVVESVFLGMIIESMVEWDITQRIEDFVWLQLGGKTKEQFLAEQIDTSEIKRGLEIMEKYPYPKDLHDAIQNGEESYEELPEHIKVLMSAAGYGNATNVIDIKGSLVVANP